MMETILKTIITVAITEAARVIIEEIDERW